MRPLPLLAWLAVPALGLARPAWGAVRAVLGLLQARKPGRAPRPPRTPRAPLHAGLGGFLGGPLLAGLLMLLWMTLCMGIALAPHVPAGGRDACPAPGLMSSKEF